MKNEWENFKADPKTGEVTLRNGRPAPLKGNKWLKYRGMTLRKHGIAFACYYGFYIDEPIVALDGLLSNCTKDNLVVDALMADDHPDIRSCGVPLVEDVRSTGGRKYVVGSKGDPNETERPVSQGGRRQIVIFEGEREMLRMSFPAKKARVAAKLEAFERLLKEDL